MFMVKNNFGGKQVPFQQVVWEDEELISISQTLQSRRDYI